MRACGNKLVKFLFFSAIAVVKGIQQRDDHFLTGCLPQFEVFPCAAFPEIVEFSEEPEVFILLFLELVAKAFQFFVGRTHFAEVGATGNIFIGVQII